MVHQGGQFAMITTLNRLFLLVSILFVVPRDLHAQLYLEGVGGVLPFDVCTCTQSPSILEQGSSALAASATHIYYTAADTLFWFNLPNGAPTAVATGLTLGNNLVYGPDGLVYFIGLDQNGFTNTLYSVNPNNGAVTNYGNLPNGIVLTGDLFFYNGNLYCTAEFNGDSGIFQVPISNPNGVILTHSLPFMSNLIGTAYVTLNGTPTLIITGADALTLTEGLYTLNMATGAYSLLCSFIFATDLAAAPGAVITCCANFAGTFQNPVPASICGTTPFTPVHNGNAVLTSGSILRFILVTDTLAPLPNALLTVSNTPNFPFNPATMSFNNTYYVAAVATTTINGAPNWNSNCLDVSYYIPVIWRPQPSVQFVVSNPNICAGDCSTVTANFTGTAPFTLTYNVPGIGQQVLNFPSNTGSFEVCLPANAPLGNLSVTAVRVVDAWCLCE